MNAYFKYDGNAANSWKLSSCWDAVFQAVSKDHAASHIRRSVYIRLALANLNQFSLNRLKHLNRTTPSSDVTVHWNSLEDITAVRWRKTRLPSAVKSLRSMHLAVKESVLIIRNQPLPSSHHHSTSALQPQHCSDGCSSQFNSDAIRELVAGLASWIKFHSSHSIVKSTPLGTPEM